MLGEFESVIVAQYTSHMTTTELHELVVRLAWAAAALVWRMPEDERDEILALCEVASDPGLARRHQMTATA